MPKIGGINDKGEVEIIFSSPLKPKSYDDLLTNFVFSGQLVNKRRELSTIDDQDSDEEQSDSIILSQKMEK